MRLRRYREGDRDAVWELHVSALEHHLRGPWDDDLATIPATYLDAGGEFLVGVEDGRIVAMGALLPHDGIRAEIKRMRVDPSVQRRGLGRRVLRRLERRAAELGYRALVLDTTTDQRGAQALYRSEGYAETGRGRAGPFELILFEKNLRQARGVGRPRAG